MENVRPGGALRRIEACVNIVDHLGPDFAKSLDGDVEIGYGNFSLGRGGVEGVDSGKDGCGVVGFEACEDVLTVGCES